MSAVLERIRVVEMGLAPYESTLQAMREFTARRTALAERIGDGRPAGVARALARRLTPLAQMVTTGYGVAGLKMALDLSGMRGGAVRPPLLPAPAGAREALTAALGELGKD